MWRAFLEDTDAPCVWTGVERVGLAVLGGAALEAFAPPANAVAVQGLARRRCSRGNLVLLPRSRGFTEMCSRLQLSVSRGRNPFLDFYSTCHLCSPRRSPTLSRPPFPHLATAE